MRLALTAAATALTLAFFVPSLHADDGAATTGHEIGVDMFASAKEGDWACYLSTFSMKGMPARTQVQVSKITKVDADSVTVSTGDRDGKQPAREQVYKKGEHMTIEKFMKDSRVQITKCDVSDETHGVNGKDFSCKKIAFTGSGGQGQQAATLDGTMWFCSDVKLGLVEVSISATSPQMEFTGAEVLQGYGNGADVTWGKAAKDVVIPAAPDGGK